MLLVVHIWACHSEEEEEGGAGETLESIQEQVPTRHCLLCHPDSMTSYKEGREQKELKNGQKTCSRKPSTPAPWDQEGANPLLGLGNQSQERNETRDLATMAILTGVS